MPVIYELKDSRPFSLTTKDQRLTRKWIVLGTQDENEVIALVLAANPLVADSLIREGITCTPSGGGVWLCDVEYGFPEGGEQAALTAPGEAPPEPTAPGGTDPLGPGYSFDTTGGTAHLTQSRETLFRRRAGDGPGDGAGTAPDYKRAIGVTKDKVEGVDVGVGKLEWSKTVARPYCSLDYIRKLRSLTYTTNDAPFHGFAGGELLYLGATGQFSAQERWNVTHKFAAGENQTDVDVGNGITIPFKSAWQYVWVVYGDAVDAGFLVQRPLYAYLERVYPPGNFNDLGIGG